MVEMAMAAAAATVRITPRLLEEGLRTRESLREYQGRGGYAAASWALTPPELRAIVDASGLRGRGGSAFPARRKWQSVAAEPAPARYWSTTRRRSRPAARTGCS